MKDSDRNFLEKLIERLKQIETFKVAILYGSLARGDEDERSDIDLLLVMDEAKPETMLRDVARIITELNPTRDVRPILTNLKDLEPSFLANVRAEGRVLFATPDAILPPPKSGYVIVKYDLSGIDPSRRSWVSMAIHGYTQSKNTKMGKKKYHYSGVGEPIAPSIIKVDWKDLDRLKEILQKAGAKYKILSQ
jgi:predicted nucleotidyltransferase